MAAIHSSLISPNAKTPPCTLWRPRAGAREITKKNACCGIVGISGSAIGIIVDLPWGLPPLVQLKGADSAPRSWLKPGFGKVFCWFLWGWRQGEGSKTYCYLFQTSNSSDIRLWGVEFHLFPGKQPNLPCFFLRFSHCLAGFGIQTAGAGLKIGIQSCPHTELVLTHGHTWWRFWKLGSFEKDSPLDPLQKPRMRRKSVQMRCKTLQELWGCTSWNQWFLSWRNSCILDIPNLDPGHRCGRRTSRFGGPGTVVFSPIAATGVLGNILEISGVSRIISFICDGLYCVCLYCVFSLICL